MATPNLIGLVLVVLLCGVGPVVGAIVVSRRSRLPFRMALVAAGFYLANLVVQQAFLYAIRATGLVTAAVVSAIVASLVYAVCEETARYSSWFCGRSMRVNRTWSGGILAGLGHGGAESIAFTLLTVGSVALAAAMPSAVPGHGARAVLYGNNLVSYYLVGMVLGRAFAVCGHLALAQLSVLAHTRSPWFLPVAIGSHFLLDASTLGLGAVLGTTSLPVTLLFLAFAVVAVAFVVICRRRWAAAGAGALGGAPVPSVGVS